MRKRENYQTGSSPRLNSSTFPSTSSYKMYHRFCSFFIITVAAACVRVRILLFVVRGYKAHYKLHTSDLEKSEKTKRFTFYCRTLFKIVPLRLPRYTRQTSFSCNMDVFFFLFIFCYNRIVVLIKARVLLDANQYRNCFCLKLLNYFRLQAW